MEGGLLNGEMLMFFWLWTIYLCIFTGHVAYIDIRTRTIPNLYIGGYGSGMIVLAGCTPMVGNHWWPIVSATLLVMIGGVLVYKVGSSWIGGGDIKYIMVLSLALGFSGTLFMVMLASWLAVLATLVRMSIWRIRFNEPMPFAPYLGFSALLVWFWPVLQS